MQALSVAGLSVLQLYLLAAALRRRQHGHEASNFTQVSCNCHLLVLEASGSSQVYTRVWQGSGFRV